MAKFWKVKAWFSNVVGKVIGLVILIAIIYVIYSVVKGAGPVAEFLDGQMGIQD